MADNKPRPKKHIPGSSEDSDIIFDFPFLTDERTINFIKDHGRIMFIVRGPPGTGKSSLTALMKDSFSDATICCADHYFSNKFSLARSKETLSISHEYCKQKAIEACMKNSHPIIIQNTHMKKFEMQPYLDLAAQHNYTIIMAITLRKFFVTAKLLEKSNKKGLKVDYFRKRLRQWEETPPYLTGWFLSPLDATYILNHLQNSISALLYDGRFCRIFNVFDKDKLLEHYEARRVLYCHAAISNQNKSFDKAMEKYYLSPKVQDSYGKSFTIEILGYLVTKMDIMAIIDLNYEMKQLMMNEDFDSAFNDFDLHELFDALSINTNLLEYSKTIPFNEKFSSPGKSIKLINLKNDEYINIKNCSFIHLASAKSQTFNLNQLIFKFNEELSKFPNQEGILKDDIYDKNENDFKISRLPETWLIKIKQKITLTTIFTGLFI